LFVAAAVLANNLMIIGELLTKRPRRRRDANRQFEVGQHAQWNGRGGGAVAGFGSAGQRHRQVLEDLDVVERDVTNGARSGSGGRLRTTSLAMM
jgi:hypothetical protein